MKTSAVLAFVALPITGFVTAASLSSSSGTAMPVAIEQQAANGRELFANNCARCHGDDAKGDKGPDLTSPKRQSKWANSEEPLINKINKGGLFMPKFGKKLSPDEIKAIADYVRSLGK